MKTVREHLAEAWAELSDPMREGATIRASNHIDAALALMNDALVFSEQSFLDTDPPRRYRQILEPS